MKVDYLIVGSGLTGAVIARALKDAGEEVLVVDRRDHLGGNVHDHFHESGIRVHTYGPHYFRTNSERIWDFVNRFSSFYKYEASLQTLVDGKFEHWPVTSEYIEREIGAGWKPAFEGTPSNFEEASLKMMPEKVYQKFIKGYSEKQWGVPASALAASLAGRFNVCDDGDHRLKKHEWQGIPSDGYAGLMRGMLAGIPTILNFDYLKNRDLIEHRKMLIFTGPIDEFFEFDLGKLMYRGQKREHQFLAYGDFEQPCGQVNNPDPNTGVHVRTLEWKHMLPVDIALRIEGTLLTTETPFTPSDPEDYEYPFPDDENKQLYRQYKSRADALADTLICGRLGEYRYYDMDQAIGRAMMLVDRILSKADRETLIAEGAVS